MKSDIFKKNILIPIIALVAIYVICYFFYEVIPIANISKNVPPFYDFANSVLFPFSDSIAQNSEFTFVGKLIRSLFIPIIIIGLFRLIISGVCMLNNATDKKEIAALCSWFIIVISYFIWLIVYHIIGWGSFSLFICGLCAVVYTGSCFEEFEKKSRSDQKIAVISTCSRMYYLRCYQ